MSTNQINCNTLSAWPNCGYAEQIEGIGCLIYQISCLDKCNEQCQQYRNRSCEIRLFRRLYWYKLAICPAKDQITYYIPLILVLIAGLILLITGLLICCCKRKELCNNRKKKNFPVREEMLYTVGTQSELILQQSRPNSQNSVDQIMVVPARPFSK